MLSLRLVFLDILVFLDSSCSWLGPPVGCGNNLHFFLTQQHPNFMMLLDRSDLPFWAPQTSWITWRRWFFDLEFDSFPITSHVKNQGKIVKNREKSWKKTWKKPEKSLSKSSWNQWKINQNVLNRPIIKNKGKSGHFGKTSIGSFSELKKYF